MAIGTLLGYWLMLGGRFGARAAAQPDMYTYDALESELHALVHRFPQSLRVTAYGHSREGRALYAAIAGDASAKHAILIQGGIHAREHMTSALVMKQLERLLYQGVPRDTVFYMLPMTNPDGVTISQTLHKTPAIEAMYAADRAAGTFTRPIEDYMREWKANAAGVDLNRNFDAQWENIHTHPRPSNANYRGPYAFSEPEARALAALTRSRHFDATISYHATGSEIYYAFGDDARVNALGLSLAEYVNTLLHYEIKPDSGLSFGGYKDWAIWEEKIPSLTIEVGINPTPLALEEWPAIWKRNKDVPYAVAEWVGIR